VSIGSQSFNVMDGKNFTYDDFTDANKTELVDLVLNALPEWTGGSY
jgi:hypothetical protein